LYGECDVAAAFLSHQGQPLAKGLIVVTTLVANVVGNLGAPKIGGNQYQCNLSL
jgi:hypothetical protein